jgi:hypothetical protein
MQSLKKVCNLLENWRGANKSMEPLAALWLDDLVMCAIFGYHHGFLDKNYWTRLGTLVQEDGEPKDNPTLCAFMGGRYLLDTTSFLVVMRSLSLLSIT